MEVREGDIWVCGGRTLQAAGPPIQDCCISVSMKVLRNKPFCKNPPSLPVLAEKVKVCTGVHLSTQVMDGYSLSFRSHAQTKKSKAVR